MADERFVRPLEILVEVDGESKELVNDAPWLRMLLVLIDMLVDDVAAVMEDCIADIDPKLEYELLDTGTGALNASALPAAALDKVVLPLLSLHVPPLVYVTELQSVLWSQNTRQDARSGFEDAANSPPAAVSPQYMM